MEIVLLLTLPLYQLLDPILIQMYPVLIDKGLCLFYIRLVIVLLFTYNCSFHLRGNLTSEISTKILYDFLTFLDTELCT